VPHNEPAVRPQTTVLHPTTTVINTPRQPTHTHVRNTGLATEHGPRRGLQVTVHRDGRRPPLVAQWGGISLARDITPRPLYDNPARIWSNRRSEVVQRLLADACELCGSTEQVEVHHVRALKDLNPKGRKHPPEWAVRMAARRRKTLIVCRVCHENVHAGRPPRHPR